jgi:hypothetical protein
MAKGIGHGNKSGGSKHSHYEFKKRCEKCNKRAKYIVKGEYLCRVHIKE